MRDGAKEYILESAEPPAALPEERRQLMRRYRQRIRELRAARKLSRGAFDYIDQFIQLAARYGDGDSLTIGVRQIRGITGFGFNTIRRYHRNLVSVGLLTFEKEYIYRKGFHYDPKYSLSFLEPSDSILESVSDSKKGSVSDSKKGSVSDSKLESPFTVKDTEAHLRLSAKREALLNRAAPQTESKGESSAAKADRNVPNGRQEATKGGKFSPSHKDQSDASKKDSSKVARRNWLLGQLRKLVGSEMDEDGNKWGSWAMTKQKHFDEFLGELRYRIKTGQKPRKGWPAFMQHVWDKIPD